MSVALAAVLHGGALLVTITPPTETKPPDGPVEVEVVVAVPPAPPPPPPPEPSVQSAGGTGQAIDKPAAPAERRKAGTPKPASAPSGDIPAVRNGAADALLARLGTPGGDGGDASRRDEATEAAPPADKAVVLPVPLADYAHAKVQYPADAVDSLASGQVLLQLSVDEQGNVTDVNVRKRAGHGFDELAAELAREYKFRPARGRNGKALPSQVGWRMAFAEWRPAPGGLQSAPQGVPSGVVALESSTPGGANGDDERAPPSPPLPPPSPPPKKMSPKEVEARPIASLDEDERHELCRWQIRIRGGVHPDACYGGATREDVLNDMVGGPADAGRGHWAKTRSASPWMDAQVAVPAPRGSGPSRIQARNEVMVFVKPEAECVEETHGMDECSVTVGEYVACMTTLAEHPCEWRRIPACYRMGKECQ